MCENPKFYMCKHCGNIFGVIKDSGVTPVCCGDAMEVLKPNTVDAATEKHVPVITVVGNNVTVAVGSVAHPMLEEHHISWIYLRTKFGAQRKCLEVGGEPKATFSLTPGDEVIAAYEYCNIHGLWMASK